MAEIHGTLGRISEAGGKEMEDIRDLYTKGISYEVATEFDGLTGTKWEKRTITDPHEALRVKIIEMLGVKVLPEATKSILDCHSHRAKSIQLFMN